MTRFKVTVKYPTGNKFFYVKHYSSNVTDFTNEYRTTSGIIDENNRVWKLDTAIFWEVEFVETLAVENEDSPESPDIGRTLRFSTRPANEINGTDTVLTNRVGYTSDSGVLNVTNGTGIVNNAISSGVALEQQIHNDIVYYSSTVPQMQAQQAEINRLSADIITAQEQMATTTLAVSDTRINAARAGARRINITQTGTGDE